MEIKRREFQQWLRDRWDKPIGVQKDSESCAIAKFIVHKVPKAEPNIQGGGNFEYYLEDRDKFVQIKGKNWMEKVIDVFDQLPGRVTGADLLKAMGWNKKHAALHPEQR